MKVALQTNPLISIIIPSYNQGLYIRETINSILAQDYSPFEVLIIDGASTDQTLNILKSYSHAPEVRWWSATDRGVTEAVNKGLQRARGEIWAIQSSDDVYLPGAFSAVAAFMVRHENIALVYGNIEYIDSNSEVIGEEVLDSFNLQHYLGRFTYIPQPTAFFRACVAKRIGGWRQEVSFAADADYWLRIVTRYKAVKLNRKLARYRYHPEQRNIQSSKIAYAWEKMINHLIIDGHLSIKTKRYARMGIHLAHYHYTPESDWINRSWHLYRAAAANPMAILNPRFPKRELIIGRYPLWQVLSKIKQRLGFKPRTE